MTGGSTTSVLRAVLAVTAALALAGCGGATAGGGPHPVTVRGAGGPLELRPWTWCSSGPRGGSCADGVPPDEPPDVGAAERVTASFPEPGWTFTATFRPAGRPCARSRRVALAGAPDGAGRSGGTITPAGPAGTYDVDVSGRGPGGDDVNATFRWTTPVDGPTPAPAATIAVLDERDGRVEGHGASLAVSGLAAAPRRASAHVTVTSSEGASLEVDPDPQVGSCSAEGDVRFDGSYEQGRRAAALGSAPFTYEVVLVLDGEEHRATAVWPRDERPGPDGTPDVPLRFAPPLPAPAR